MIGKNKSTKYSLLVFLISSFILVNSFYFKVYNFIIFYSLSIISTIIVTKYGLRLLKKYNISQKIRKEGPSAHIIKENTPTMGGLFFIPLFLIVVLIVNIPSLTIKLAIIILTSGFFFIGILDDYLSIKNQTNLGLRGKQKLLLQILFALIFTACLSSNNLLNSNIQINENFIIALEGFILPFSVITILALSNSVNLTDGLDGLAVGCSAIVFSGLGAEILFTNDDKYLIFSLLSFTMAGLCLGFLKFNKYPAKIFMGDTGSLCLGAVIGAICVITNSYFITLIISGIFVIEAISVIMQVLYFKITRKIFKKGKKLFLMSPIHHHFELKGTSEPKIVEIFWSINIILVIFSIVLKISF